MNAYELELSILAQANQTGNLIESVIRLRALDEISRTLGTEALMELASTLSSSSSAALVSA